MAHKGKKGTRPISIETSDKMRSELLEITGEKTLTGAIHATLREHIRSERCRQLQELSGSLDAVRSLRTLEDFGPEEMLAYRNLMQASQANNG